MRTTYLVCYDISNDKRLKLVFKACKNWGNHLQYSVFECDLNASERTAMEEELKTLIHNREDQVLFIALGPSEGRGERVITSLGIPYVKIDAPCYVV